MSNFSAVLWYFDWAKAEHPARTCVRVPGDFTHSLHVMSPCVVPVLWTVYTLVGLSCSYSSITPAMIWVVQSRSQAKHPLWLNLLSCHLACKSCSQTSIMVEGTPGTSLCPVPQQTYVLPTSVTCPFSTALQTVALPKRHPCSDKGSLPPWPWSDSPFFLSCQIHHSRQAEGCFPLFSQIIFLASLLITCTPVIGQCWVHIR